MASEESDKASAERVKDEDVNDHDKTSRTSDGNEYFLPSSQRTKRLPDWLDHFNLRDLKILFKCSLAVWIITLLIVIEPALKAIGQATFFGVVVVFIAPPSGVVFIGLLVGATIAIGVCLGWAWGVITMKAALATRPAADLQAQLAALQAAASQNSTNIQQATGQATFQQIAIYDGFLLDTRVTLTYFCMLGLFIYLVARIRVAAPKLQLVQMFAIIITDIFLTIGPLLPQFTGTIPQTLIFPALIAVGVNLACNLLFFPESTSYLVLLDMERMLRPMDNFLKACTIHLAKPSVMMNLERLNKTKAEILKYYGGYEANLGFLTLDVSVSRWSAGDVKSLQTPLRHAMLFFIGLIQFEVSRLEFQLKDETILEMAENRHEKNDKHVVAGGHQFARAFDLRQQFRPSNGDHNREEVLKLYGTMSSDLFNSSQQALVMVREALHECNNRRWFDRTSVSECETLRSRHAEALGILKIHLDQFPNKVAQQVWERYKITRDQQNTDGDSSAQRQAVYILVMEEKLMAFAQAVHTLLTHVVTLEAERQRTRFWWPSSIKDIIPLALDTSAPDADQEPKITRIQTTTDKGYSGKKSRKTKENNVSSVELAKLTVTGSRRTTQRSMAGKIVLGVAHWLSNTEGLFALRTLVVSMGIGALAANRNTAGFFYREKGLWALIMAQTALTPYTGDFIYGMVVRLSGTIIGAVLGLAAWYIGAGNGPGNPYGIAAIMVPIIVVAMWLRLFTSPAMLQGIIIATITSYLVVSYSWVDTHIPSYGNPGVGVSVFWRRMLLVMIGFGAATLVTLFPRPPSANRHYRRILSASLQTNKDQYALFVGTKSALHKPEDVREVAQKTAIGYVETLMEIQPQIKLTKLELSTSNFDSETLSLVCHLCMNVNQYITQLTIYTAELPQAMKDRFFQGTGAGSEEIVGDIMAVFTIIQHALVSGDSLPAVLPTPLMERRISSMKARLDAMDVSVVSFTAETLADRGTRRYLSAVAAFVQFLGTVDELVLVVKRAVGETSYIDMEA